MVKRLISRISWYPLILLGLSTSACNTLPTQTSEITVEDTSSPEVSQEQIQTRTPPKRPALELTEDILYKLLLAEIAGQRGQLDVAVENYMELARQTRDPKVVGRATRIAIYARDDQSAREAAQLWVELDPENPDAHQVLAIMAVRAGDIDEAIEHLEQILNFSNGLLNQKLWMIANLLGNEKDQEVVMTIMEKLMVDHQEDPEALYAYAHVIARMGDVERSQELLEKILELVPDNQNAITSYISILQKQGNPNAAIEWIEKTLNENQDNFELRMIYARLLTDVKRFDDATEQFEILIQQDPNNKDVLYALGLLSLQVQQLDESKKYFQRLLELEQQVNEASYYLGRIAEEEGDFENASIWYEGVQKGENYFDAQIRAGMLLAKQDKIEEARNHIRSIRVKGKEQESLLIQAEGELLIEEKRYGDAIAVYNTALLDNYDADLLYARAMLAEKMDRLDILEQDLRAILERDPKNAQALNALGYTLADRTERYDEAHELIKRALEISPNDFYILDSMGWILYRLGRLEESIKYLNMALDERRDPEIAAHLGEVLWVIGDRDAAKEIWETALQETPEDNRLLDVIKRFIP
jgi:tetratricopeptide (TPR) repeat protein